MWVEQQPVAVICKVTLQVRAEAEAAAARPDRSETPAYVHVCMHPPSAALVPLFSAPHRTFADGLKMYGLKVRRQEVKTLGVGFSGLAWRNLRPIPVFFFACSNLLLLLLCFCFYSTSHASFKKRLDGKNFLTILFTVYDRALTSQDCPSIDRLLGHNDI